MTLERWRQIDRLFGTAVTKTNALEALVIAALAWLAA